MNVGKYNNLFCLLFILLLAGAVVAESPRQLVDLGNEFYNQGEFEKAIEQYDSAIAVDDKSAEAVFDKAASLYRLGDFTGAVELYNDSAIKATDDELAIKSRYNLGNCYFARASASAKEKLQEAIKDLKQAVGYWRKVLDIDSANEKASGNMQIAKALVQQLKEQMQNQQQDPNSEQDPNSQQDPNQPQDPNNQQQSDGENDPNDQQEQNQQNSDPNQANYPNENQQSQPEQSQEQEEPPEQKQDMTAQQILEKEQQQKEQRQMLIKSQSPKVEKDW